jgi:hypothetical protein
MKCDRVRKAFDSHLSRAKWMTESTVIVTCYYVVVRRLKATLQFVPSARRKSKPRRPRLACRLFDSRPSTTPIPPLIDQFFNGSAGTGAPSVIGHLVTSS